MISFATMLFVNLLVNYSYTRKIISHIIVTMILLANTIHLSDGTVIICISNLPCGTKSLREFILADWQFFVV